MRSMEHRTLGMAAVQIFLMMFFLCTVNGQGEVALGSEVRLTDNEQFLKSEFSKTKYGWADGMRVMYGRCFKVITDTGFWKEKHMVGLPSPNGEQNGVWYFPLSVLSKCQTPSPTEEPTSPPTCIEKQIWTEQIAGNNCPASFTTMIFGIKACKSSYQERLEFSLANQLYEGCGARCVYDYDMIINDNKGAFVYRKRKKCYRYTTKRGCFKNKKYDRAVERAKKLC